METLWAISDINFCKIHQVRLEEKCQNCDSNQYFLTPTGENGFCHCCKSWLGHKKMLKNNEIEKDIKLVNDIEEILKSFDKKKYSNTTLIDTLSFIKNHLFPIPKLNFCKMVLKVDIRTYNSYLKAIRLPELNNLVKISTYFNIPLIEVFKRDINKN